jgi:hypothetical protein
VLLGRDRRKLLLAHPKDYPIRGIRPQRRAKIGDCLQAACDCQF